MTYKQGCKYAALLGIPCLLFDVMARVPPLYHVPAAHRLARILLFPGWQAVSWMTGGMMARTFEYKLLMPLVIIGFNVLAWGAVVWSVANVVESRRIRD